VLSAAQLASREGCLNLRIYSAPVTPKVICVPIGARPSLMTPTLMTLDGGHTIAIVATGPHVTKVVTSTGVSTTPRRVIARTKTDYAAFGLTVVDVPDRETSVNVTVQSIDRAGQQKPSETTVVISR
jgi:hypothetical protein